MWCDVIHEEKWNDSSKASQSADTNKERYYEYAAMPASRLQPVSFIAFIASFVASDHTYYLLLSYMLLQCMGMLLHVIV